MKRIIALFLTFVILMGCVPSEFIIAKATIGDTTIYDLCRPTTGAVAFDKNSLEITDPTLIGITDTTVGGVFYMDKTTAGTNWKLNVDKTTTPLQNNSTLYAYAGTSSSNRNNGMIYQKWGTATSPQTRTVIMLNYNNKLAIDVAVPESGSYLVQVTYLDHASHQPISVNVNDGALVATRIGTSTSTSQEKTIDVGTVSMLAGTNTIIVQNATNSYQASMIRSIGLTKTAEVATPTQAPTQTPTQAPTLAPTQTPTVSGTTFTIDFLNSTDGASLNGVVGGVNLDTAQKGGYKVTTSFAGNGWKINTTETNVTLESDGTTYYNDEFMLYYKSIRGVESAMAFRRYKYVAFDFTVPEAGVYEVTAKFEPYGVTGLTDWYVNDKNTRLNRTAAGLTGDTTIGQVVLRAGEYANTIYIRNQGSGTHTYLQSVTFTKVADAPQPTATPTPAPTVKPTLAPTLDPNATQAPFSVSVTTADNSTIYTADGVRFYMTADTKGANWKVHPSTSEKNFVQGTTIAASNRFYYSGTTPNMLQVYASGNTVIAFTAPQGGDYDLTSIVNFQATGGYGDVYVNDQYVGTIDCNQGEGFNEQKLLGVTLYAGEYANTISFKQAGRSTGSNSYLYLQGFNFTPVAVKAKKTGLEIKIDSTQLYVGDEKQVTTVGKTTNGAFYRLASVNVKDITYASSDNSVATISSGGLIKALKAGTTTISAHSATLNETGTITLTISDVAYTEAEVNVEEGALVVARDTITLEAKAKFNNGDYAPQSDIIVVYESDDEDVFKVEDGVLVAVGEGTAKLTAKVTYKGVTHNAVRTINVLKYEAPQAFKFDFATADKLITRPDGQAWYFSKETHGDLWRIDASETTKGTLGTDPDNSGALRFFMEEKYSYFRPMTSGKEYVFDFTAPIAGTYDITAYAVAYNGGGYGDIYINDVYVGSVDCYTPETTLVPFNLLGVKLKPGEYANEFRFVPTGEKSSASSTNTYTAISRLDFTPTEEPATLTAIETSADVSAMYVGREEQIDVAAVLSKGGIYRLKKCEETLIYESSDNAVATVSSAGKIIAKGAGEVTITVTTSKTKLSDTITFRVTDASYDKVVVNITEGEEFYVTNERALEVVATLADGTEIAQKDLVITYSSSNQGVAKVEDNVLKIVAKGNATISADVKFRVTGETKSDVKNITATTIPLKGITARPAKSVVQELDWDGVQLIVQGVAYDGTIIDDLEVAGFTQRDFTYEALTPDIMTVDANGICKYVSRGTAQIKVTANLDGVPFEQVVDVVSSSAKRGRTLYTEDMIENARYNATHTSWGVAEVKRVSGQSYRFVYSFEHIYDLIFAEGIPRSEANATVNAQNDVLWYCPACETNIQELYRGKWETNILENPWKIWCPHCKMQFPSNDFGLLYQRGLDENGMYNRELAHQRNAEAVARGEKDALVNELYPNKDPLWMVDDGFGWSPALGTYGTNDPVQYTPVAKYAHDFWYNGSFSWMGYILYKIRDIYLWTGDERFAVAGCILLDRVADVYPGYDVHELGVGYHISHGGGKSGKIVGSIQENYLAQYFAECYDAFYPEFDNPQVIEFLSKKAIELNLDNPKTNGNLIRENIENGILRESIDAVRTAKIYGNFGFHQAAMVKAAVALDTQPETDEALKWLIQPCVLKTTRYTDPIFGGDYYGRYENTGGEFVTKYANEIDRDGFGAEVSISYNQIWLNSGVEIADILRNYDSDVLDLYANPKFVNMYDSFIYMTAGDGYSLALGDGGKVCEANITSFADQVARGYRALRTPILAQVYDAYVQGSYKSKVIDFYADQKDLIVSMQADIAEHGKLELESRNLTGYGLAMLRGGKAATKENQYETRYDTWMYYGRTELSHAHWDMLQLGIDAFGFNFTPDQGYPEATSRTAHRYEWVKASISHNLVLVNEDSQTSIYTGTPLHFDSTDNVKLIDIEAPDAYEDAEIYRRTAITISANDDVAYTVDLFRVKGGNAHTYSFHTQGYHGWSTKDIDMVPQVDEHGAYVGTYASPDWEYGHDPNSTDTEYATNPVYPRGYTWIRDVNRGKDKTGDGVFTIDFKQTNFRDQVVDAAGLALKIHGVNDWVADSIDIGVGSVPRKKENEKIPGLDYLLIQRRGENLDTLFATILEPYKVNSYIVDAKPLDATIKSGTEGVDDISKVIKVTLENRIDYIIYATNKNVVYTVTDGDVSFDFAGFVGVYTVDANGNNIYSYVNDGTIIGNQTSIGAYTGTVVDFTKELVLDDYIIIKPDQEIADLATLENQYIYIDNPDSKCNGSYRIISAEQQGENISLYLGNCSLIEGYIDDYNLDAGYVYTIADGQNFRIPVSAMEGSKFTGTNRVAGVDTTVTAEETVAEEVVVENIDTHIPFDGGDTNISDITQDSKEEGATEPSATPNATEAPEDDAANSNASGNAVRNILLGALGILALSAGIFLILLGKKKDEENA